MNHIEARELCRTKMNEFGLVDWGFEWSTSKQIFGQCSCSRKRIKLSHALVGCNTVERVLLTILHEIAHALTPGAGHSIVWKLKCKEIGGNGQTCYSSENTTLPVGKYIYRCKDCGHQWTKDRKMFGLDSKFHIGCKHKENRGKLEELEINVYGQVISEEKVYS